MLGFEQLLKFVTFTSVEDQSRQFFLQTNLSRLHLDLYKVSDSVLHSVNFSELERHGSDSSVTLWIRNWVNDCTQSIAAQGPGRDQQQMVFLLVH